MTDPDPDHERLRKLSEQVRSAKGERDARIRPAANDGSGARGYRMASDFLSAILVGVGLGLGLDWLFGTAPWMLLIFMMLGFAAGMRMVMRQANTAMAQDGAAGEPEPEKDEAGGHGD